MRWLALIVFLLVGCAPRPRPQTRAQWTDAFIDCRRGEQDACLWVAVSHENRGNYVEAVQLLERACEGGIADACSELAFSLEKGRGVPKDLARAAALEQRACDRGSAQGCHSLGVAYFRALGVPKDLVRSTQLYERACKAGWPEACRDLGNALAEGRAGTKDLAAARKLWRQTCPGDEDACVILAKSLRTEAPANALSVVKEGCAAHHDESCYWAGRWFAEDGDAELAMRYARTACAWNEEHCNDFGDLLAKLKRYDEARILWKENCARGIDSSCFRQARWSVQHGGSREAGAAEFERLCRKGYTYSCQWLCLNEEDQPTDTPCEAACALGVKEKCPAESQ